MTEMSFLERTKTLEAAATPGGWEAYPDGFISSAHGPVAAIGDREPSDFPTDADAEFIAHSRTAVPEMVTALESVLSLHVPKRFYEDDDNCRECLRLYPCPTVIAATIR